MNVLYVYAGRQSREFEEEVRSELHRRHGEVRQLGSEFGQGDMTTVTLAFDEPLEDVHAVVETLRGYRDVVDAAEGSFGEGA
jgi:hypothetical protein